MRGDAACPWRPTGDPTTALLQLIQRTRTQALSVSGGSTAGPGELYDALLAGLESQSSWPTLADTLAQADGGDGTSAASMSSRYETGGSSNGAAAEQAIDCVDHPVDRDPSVYPALAASLGRTAPVFGPLLAWGLLGCATWSALPTRTPSAATDPGAPPILVVGTTGDPVTPYAWSVDLARELSGGASAHVGREQPCGLLLQPLRPRHRRVVPAGRDGAAHRSDLHGLTCTG